MAHLRYSGDAFVLTSKSTESLNRVSVDVLYQEAPVSCKEPCEGFVRHVQLVEGGECPLDKARQGLEIMRSIWEIQQNIFSSPRPRSSKLWNVIA